MCYYVRMLKFLSKIILFILMLFLGSRHRGENLFYFFSKACSSNDPVQIVVGILVLLLLFGFAHLAVEYSPYGKWLEDFERYKNCGK